MDPDHFAFILPRLPKTLFTALVAILTTTSPLMAQTSLGPFEVAEGIDNPLHKPLAFPAWPAPALVDLDKDGDKDLAVGSSSQTGGYAIHYYRNDGTAQHPVFIEQMDSDNPFYFVVYNFSGDMIAIKPTFTDADGDGDADLFVGSQNGQIRFYKNVTNWTSAVPDITFQAQTGEWNAAEKTGNPFHNVVAGSYSAPYAVDFDKDGDDDVLLGTLADGSTGATTHLYLNDGQYRFTRTGITGVNPSSIQLVPIAYDIDNDNDPDIITGEKDGTFRLFRNNGSDTFSEEVNWSLLNEWSLGQYTAPALSDLDGDNKPEFILGGTPSSSQSVVYLKNNGDGSFEQLSGFDSPFGGIHVGRDASPYFSDVDGDGDADVIIGSRSGAITYLRNDNTKYTIPETAANPFNGLVTGSYFSLSFVDLDGDGRKDIVGPSADQFEFFKNTPDGFVLIPFSEGPFSHIALQTNGKADFGDIDADGDLDLIVSDELPWSNGATRWGFFIRYFENTGNTTAPQFTERTDAENFFAEVLEEYTLYPRFVDVDRDGDLDVAIGEGGNVHAEIPESNEFIFFENTSTSMGLSFTHNGNLIPQYSNATEPSPSFVDADGDGDLDIYQGNTLGELVLYINENPPAEIIFSSEADTLTEASGVVLLDGDLEINDPDLDRIVKVTISIQGKTPSDRLTWEIPPRLPGVEFRVSYDEASGVLIISGKGDIDQYEQVLRSVKFEYSEAANGRTQMVVATKVLHLEVADEDGTTSFAYTRTFRIDLDVNNAPNFDNGTITLNAGATQTIDLMTLAADTDGDLDLNSFSVLRAPSSGAAVEIDEAGVLTVDYSGVAFAGEEDFSVQVCDLAGACDAALLSVNVTNSSPLFSNETISITKGSTITVNLAPLVADEENNVLWTSLAIVQQPSSGALLTLNGDAATIDYSNNDFVGTEQLRLSICDVVGACGESVITINVTAESEVVVYNAVAPKGSSELNRYLHIANLPENNTVSIYNRWGDVVFSAVSYRNDFSGKRFEGLNNSGNALPSGTYFYKIEYQLSDPGSKQKTLTGYLSLQQ